MVQPAASSTDIEQSMIDEGINKFRSNSQRLKEKGREDESSYGVHLTRLTIDPLARALKEYVGDGETGKAGRRSLAYKYLIQFKDDMDVVAYLVARSAMSSISEVKALTSKALEIGRAIEDEARFRLFDETNPDLFYVVMKDLKYRTNSRDMKRGALKYSMQNDGIEWTNWPTSDLVHLGRACLHLFEESTGLIETVRVRKSRTKTTNMVQATEYCMELIKNREAASELFFPVMLPTTSPPMPWTSPTSGGYHTRGLRLTLVKTRNNRYLEDLRHVDMEPVYKSVNAVQATAWSINTPVLEVMRNLWDAQSNMALPSQSPRPLPVCPVCNGNVEGDKGKHPCFGNEDNAKALWKWKKDAARIYDQREIDRGHVIQVFTCLQIASRYAEMGDMYFPHQLDFRGRLYAVPRILNPQGADFSKGLLQFAKPKKLGTPLAAFWLAVHGANQWGEDKVSLEDRVQWVQDHSDEIFQVACDPYSNKWWADADEPWQFLAWCFEWAGYMTDGLDWESRCVVSIDGSCNGLQHFSAMVLDPIGAKEVNLGPSESPNDIYQSVADKVLASLRAYSIGSVSDSTDKDVQIAEAWLQFGVDRSTTKRPVMILPYGGTRFAMRKYTDDHVKERINDGEHNAFGDNENSASNFLSWIIWNSIRETVVSAGVVMDWLQHAASLVNKQKLPISWTTPAGFPVRQAYPEMRTREIRTKLGDKFIKGNVMEEIEGSLDAKQQTRGISPNYVHSLDAAALMLTVCRCMEEHGIESFGMVHDSYGTHAADAEALGQATRQVFYEMYSQQDVLQDFSDEVNEVLPDGGKLPDVPAKGDFDISQVLHSDFFFA